MAKTPYLLISWNTTKIIILFRKLKSHSTIFNTNFRINQGRIQDLSEGVVRFISEQKHPDLGTKRKEKIDIYPVLHRFSFPYCVLLRRYSEILGGGGWRSCRPCIRPCKYGTTDLDSSGKVSTKTSKLIFIVDKWDILKPS